MSTGQSIDDYTHKIVAGSQHRSRVQHSDFTLEFDWAEAPLTELAPLSGDRFAASDDLAPLLDKALAFAG